MEQYIRNRLEYVEETFAGEMETWVDPVTNTYYTLPIEVYRDWDNIQQIESYDKRNYWHPHNEQHYELRTIRNLPPMVGACG